MTEEYKFQFLHAEDCDALGILFTEDDFEETKWGRKVKVKKDD